MTSIQEQQRAIARNTLASGKPESVEQRKGELWERLVAAVSATIDREPAIPAIRELTAAEQQEALEIGKALIAARQEESR